MWHTTEIADIMAKITNDYGYSIFKNRKLCVALCGDLFMKYEREYLFYKVKHNTPQRTNGIMVGTNAIVAICVLGVISHNVYFFSAVIGLAMADKLGRKMEWCK